MTLALKTRSHTHAGTTSNSSENLTDIQKAVLADLSHMTYHEISEKYGWSRGKIYQLALRTGARKHEARIQERHKERRQRQYEILEEIIGTTTTSDVLDFLESLPDNVAQLVLTSPPYNIGKRYGDGTSDNMRHVYYIGWLYQIVSECARVLKHGGTLALQTGSTHDENNVLIPIDTLLMEPARKAGLTFINRVVWPIPHGLTPKNRLAERYETILIFSKGEQSVFNPGSARQPQKQPTKRYFKGPKKGQLSCHPLGAHPTNIWPINNIGHNHPEKTGHPAQYPEELARRAINLYSMPGDLVIDPFSGSGTTHVACIQTGRQFCGADLFYEDSRIERLRKTMAFTESPLSGVTDASIAARKNENTKAVWQAEAVRNDHVPESQTAILPKGQTADLFSYSGGNTTHAT